MKDGNISNELINKIIQIKENMTKLSFFQIPLAAGHIYLNLPPAFTLIFETLSDDAP